MTWWMYAFASALAASATAILAKIGINGVPSNLATAVRTAVVLVVACGAQAIDGQLGRLDVLRSQGPLP